MKEEQQKKNQDKLHVVVFVSVMILWIISFVLHFRKEVFTLSFLSLIGIYLCSSIVWHIMGSDNALINTFCSASHERNCDTVLTSKFSRISKNITVADIGLVYFIGQFFFLFILNLIDAEILGMYIISIPCLLGLVITFVSLWYQGMVLKVWCKLCLLVITVLWAQFFIIAYFLFTNNSNFIYLKRSQLSFQLIVLFFLAFITACIWLVIKNTLVKADMASKHKRQFLEWKNNPNVLIALLKTQRNISIKSSENDFEIGNPSAEIHIVIFFKPFCVHCKRTYTQLEELMSLFSNSFRANLQLMVDSTNYKRRTKTIKAINTVLNVYYSQDNQEKQHALRDWFDLQNIQKYKQKYQNFIDNTDYTKHIQKQDEVVKKNAINTAPAIFVNGYELPIQYKLQDLQLLIGKAGEL